MKKILVKLYPGLRGKLAVFTGVMVFTLIAVMLSISLKQQQNTIWNYSLGEVNERLSPVIQVTREMQYLVENLGRLEGLSRRISKKGGASGESPEKAYYKSYFQSGDLDTAYARLRTYLSQQISRPVEEKEFERIKQLSARLHRYRERVSPTQGVKKNSKNFRRMRKNGRRLDKELRKIYQYQDTMTRSFLGMDRSKFRVEAFSLFNQTLFDTIGLEPAEELRKNIREVARRLKKVDRENEPEKYRAVASSLRALNSRYKRQSSVGYENINRLSRKSDKTLPEGLNRVRNSFYGGVPLTDSVQTKHNIKNREYTLTTSSVFYNPLTSERARNIKKALSGPYARHWRGYLREEGLINEKLNIIAGDIKKRLDFLKVQKPPIPPYLDNEQRFQKSYEAYKLLLDERSALITRYGDDYLRRSNSNTEYLEIRVKELGQRIKSLGPEIKTARSVLKKISRKKEAEKYKIALTHLRSLKKELKESKAKKESNERRLRNDFSVAHEVVDAFRYLREETLRRNMILRFAYEQEAYRNYTESSKNRKRAYKEYDRLRGWVKAGCSETSNCLNHYISRVAGQGFLLKSRSEAEKEMWAIDSASLESLANRVLFENTAGFLRIIFDGSDVTALIKRESGRLIDTALAIGIRVVFLAFLISVFLVQTIRDIIKGAEKVGRGDLTTNFTYDGHDEMGSLVESLNHMVSGLKEREEMRGELAAAEEIQKQMLPAGYPPGMDGELLFGHFYKAMSGVGGDYYDFIDAGKDEMVFCVADVSNHGVGPAIVMTITRSQLHAVVRRGVTDPVKILAELNGRLYEETPASMFVTMFVGVYNKQTNMIRYSSAGHNKSLLFHTATGTLKELPAGGMPLGAVDNDFFEPQLKPYKVELQSGDLFFQFTDGVNEAMDDDFNQFGYDRMQAVLKKEAYSDPEIIVETMAREVEAFTRKKIFCEGPSELNDDIAMLAIRRIS